MRNYCVGVSAFALGALFIALGSGVKSPFFWAPLLIAVPVFIWGYVTLKRAGR